MKKNIIIAIVSFIAGFATSCYISKKLEEVEAYDSECLDDEDFDGTCPCCGCCESEGDAIVKEAPKSEPEEATKEENGKAEATKEEDSKTEDTKAEEPATAETKEENEKA